MPPNPSFKRSAAAALLLACALAHAAGAKVGMAIEVEGDGVFWNPVVSRIRVTAVDSRSLAQAAGIVAGDEIIQVEGRAVAGQRARDLQAFMQFNPGETRTLRLKHASGEQFEARLTKPIDKPTDKPITTPITTPIDKPITTPAAPGR